MSRLSIGLISGIIFGGFVVATMLPMSFPDKRAALSAAFFSRFAIGLLIGAMVGSPQLVALGVGAWLIGAVVGLLVSVPDAIVTKAYAPILVIGTLGGGVIGWIVGR